VSDDVNVTFGASIDGALQGINALTEGLESFGANVEGLVGPLAAVGEAAAAAFAVEKIVEWTEKVVDAGVDLARFMAQTGDTAEEVNVLSFAAEGSDNQLSLLTRTITQFSRIAEESQGTTSAAARAFGSLGINVQQLIGQGKSMGDIFELTNNKLQGYKDSLNKSALESVLFGGRSTQLSLALKDLATKHQEMQEAVERSGITVAGFADAARDTKEGLVESGQATQGFSNNLFVIFKPAIDAAILGFRGFVESMNESLQHGGLLWGIMQLLSGAFLILETVVIATAETIKIVFETLITSIKAVLAMVETTVNVLGDVVHGKFKQIGKDITDGNANVVKGWKTGLKQMAHDTDETTKKLMKTWSDYFHHISTKAKASAADVKASSGGNAPTIGPDPKQAMNQDIQLHKAMLQEEVADVGQNLQAKMILQQEYYDWLKAKYPQNATALAEAGRQIAQTQDQEAKASAATWDRFFNGFNGSIMGMLRGTQTFKQSIQSMFGSVVEFALKAIDKIVSDWLGAEITKIDATNAGNAARTASDATAAAAGKAVQKATDTTSVLASAKTGAAAAYSSTAAIPIIGPVLAPAAAAAAFGAILAFDSFETGTPYVPKTGPYLLHEGEEVRPANVGGGDSGGGAGGQVHLHVNAMDGQSVQRFFDQHGDKLAAQVVDQFKRGNTAFRYPR
jgi:hypothetical protein